MTSSRASSSNAAGSAAGNANDLTVTSPVDATSKGASSNPASDVTPMGISSISAAADATPMGASRRFMPNPASRGKGLKAILKGTAEPVLQGSRPAASSSKRKVRVSADEQSVHDADYHPDSEADLGGPSIEPIGKRLRSNALSGTPLAEESDSDDKPLRPRSAKAKGKQKVLLQESESDEQPKQNFRKAVRHYFPQLFGDSEDDAPIARSGTGRKAFPRASLESSCEDSCEDSIDSDALFFHGGREGSEDETLSQILADLSDPDEEEDLEEEYFPGPDVFEEEEDEDEEGFSGHDEADQPQYHGVEDHNERFVQILETCLEELVSWAKRQNSKVWEAKPASEREMTIGSRRILSRTNAKFLLGKFLPAISREVQDFIASKDWTLDAILTLPTTRSDRRQGIYGNFPTKGPTNQPKKGCECYVGSSWNVHERTYGNANGHKRIANKYTPKTLPTQHKGSLHYNYICQGGVENHFRLLAGFNKSIAPGYNQALEGVMMILFGTYTDRGRYHRWATKASYSLTRNIRTTLETTLGLPVAPWSGLNAAWSLYQGIARKSLQVISPCANKVCGQTTYPWKQRPEGYPKCPRILYDPVDPLGKYICPACGRYRSKNHRLPDKKWCQKAAERIRFRAENRGDDLACDCCGLLESQVPKKPRALKDGTFNIHKRCHVLHPDYPGKRFCSACVSWIQRKNRLRTPLEVAELRAHRELAECRLQGIAPVCDNCQAVEGGLASKGEHHSRDGLVLCMPCYNYYSTKKRNGKPMQERMRDPQLQRAAEARAQASLNA